MRGVEDANDVGKVAAGAVRRRARRQRRCARDVGDADGGGRLGDAQIGGHHGVGQAVAIAVKWPELGEVGGCEGGAEAVHRARPRHSDVDDAVEVAGAAAKVEVGAELFARTARLQRVEKREHIEVDGQHA